MSQWLDWNSLYRVAGLNFQVLHATTPRFPRSSGLPQTCYVNEEDPEHCRVEAELLKEHVRTEIGVRATS